MLLQIFYNTVINYLLFNFVYYLTSGVLFVIDYFGFFISNKIQNTQEYLDYYKKCLPCVLVNTLLYVLLPCSILGYYEYYQTKLFTVRDCIFDLTAAVILTDIFFYTVHRILHLPYFYAVFHKQHHEIVAPVGLSAVYTTLIDFYIGNIFPVFLPMYILDAHVITIRIWLVIITLNTVLFAHSGFGIADYHDKHHSLFTKNYGTNLFMDKLFHTNYD